MTQVTERGTLLSAVPQAGVRRRSPAAARCVLGGAMAAGLGLGSLAVLVIALWISSPYPDSGPGSALHLAAGLWLLAHGADLIRYETLSGTPAPVGVTPLLLVALPVLLMWRAAARLRSTSGGRSDGEEGLPASVVFSAVTCGYLAVGAPATVYAAGGPVPVDPLSAAWHVPLVAVLAAAGGVWVARGRPLGPLPEWVPKGVRRAVVRPRYALALRSGAAGALVLLGGAILLVCASLAWHGAEVQTSFLELTGVWSGRFAVLLLALALIPNAMVWGAAYALGPGFALGAGATATPLGFEGSAALPRFPLLAALPPEGPGTPLTWAVAGMPVVAGLVVGWFAVRRARDVSCGETALTAALGALVCGLALAGLAAASSGPLGSRELARFGPVWWQVGGAAVAWTLGLAVPLAVSVQAWRNRPVAARGGAAWRDTGRGAGRHAPGVRGLPRGAGRQALAVRGLPRGASRQALGVQGLRRGAGAGDGGHSPGVRELCWEALRRVSGTLIPDLPATGDPAPAASAQVAAPAPAPVLAPGAAPRNPDPVPPKASAPTVAPAPPNSDPNAVRPKASAPTVTPAPPNSDPNAGPAPVDSAGAPLALPDPAPKPDLTRDLLPGSISSPAPSPEAPPNPNSNLNSNLHPNGDPIPVEPVTPLVPPAMGARVLSRRRPPA